MLRKIATLFAILILFSACGRSSNAITPNLTDTQGPSDQATSDILSQVDESGYGRIGAFDLLWDTDNGTIETVERAADVTNSHYNVTWFLEPSNCSNCIVINVDFMDITNGFAKVSVDVTNPTKKTGYEVRGIVRIPVNTDVTLVNATSYTSFTEAVSTKSGYKSVSPFRLFNSNDLNHTFGPGETHSETFQLRAPAFSGMQQVELIVSAGYPSHPGDPSLVNSFNQKGQLLNGGGSANLRFNVLDLQDDVTGVWVNADVLGAGTVPMSYIAGSWQATLNNFQASPGIYDIYINAVSNNDQGLVTSNIYRAVVFEDFDQFRTDLLAMVNADRASEGNSPLIIDYALNTVAQFHAQDMADRKYFSHTNLDQWSPWDRMKYYGVTYNSAGENIAVGYDSPTAVETAWMNSSGHRGNIMNSKFGKIGIGIVSIQPGDKYYPGYYWVQEFTN
ncbi:MAG TPA: CAP domain-containing protein [bacterium]|jgi:uncharacterized protein YkwD